MRLPRLLQLALEVGVRQGFGLPPEIDYLALATDPRGDVRVTVHAKAGGSVKLAVSKSAFPSAATVRAASANNLDADKNFTSGVLHTVREDEITYLGAYAYELAGGAGKESQTLYQVQGRGGERFRAKVYNSVNQNINNGTVTALTFDSEDHDVGALHDTGSNTSRITIPTGGDKGQWLLVATVAWDLSAAGARTVRIRKNGTTTVAESLQAPEPGGGATHNVVAIVDAPAVGDYFEVVVIQGSGGTLAVQGGLGNTFFTAVHLW